MATRSSFVHASTVFACVVVLGAAACSSERAHLPARDCAGESGIEDLLEDQRAAEDVLAVVETEAGAGWVVREARGDRMSLCPDCNEDGSLPFCAECAHDVVRYENGRASIELDRVYATASYDRVIAATAATTSTGDVVIAWQRRLGASGLAPTEARFARVSVDGERISPNAQLFASDGGRLRLVAHPREPKVLVLRDNDVVLSHIGTHVSVVDLDGAPLLPWTQLGSSLGHGAGASAHGTGFVVAFSDQAVDTPDPDCQPCTTLESCFGTGVIDVTEELPSVGCVAFLEASEAGGLQAVAVDETGVGAPVQIRSGWYERIYGGEMQRLYADHGHASVVETETGFTVVADYFGDLTFSIALVGVDFDGGRIEQRSLTFDLSGSSPNWYALARIAGAETLLVGLSSFQEDASRAEVRAIRLDETGCSGGRSIATYDGALAMPLGSSANGTVSATVGYWDEAGGSFARTELHRFGAASD